MPSRRSTAKMPKSTAPKPRAEPSLGAGVGVERPKPKMTNAEKLHALRQAARRQARFIEEPAYLQGLRAILFPKKLPAYPAYDDGPVSKRRKFVHRPKIELLKRRSRARILQIPSRSPSIYLSPSPPPPASPVPSPSPTPSSASSSSSSSSSTPSSRSPTPSHVSPSTEKSPAKPRPVCTKFMELPTEIHQEIMRHLLIWPQDIIVFRGWSIVYPRTRPQLQVAILSTCRLLKARGLPVLFGENTFAYSLRDPKVSHSHTNPVLGKVFDNCIVPINTYGHLIRYIRVKVDRNRLHFNDHRIAFENAIQKFLPGGGLAEPANFHTLTLEVPALTNFDLAPDPELPEPNGVPIRRYLLDNSKVGKALLEIKTQWVRVLAWDRFKECWETEIDMRYYFHDQQMKLESMTQKAGKQHSDVVTTDRQNKRKDPDEGCSYRTRDVEVMEERWRKNVEEGVSGVRNLSWRIEMLAIDPELVAEKIGVWRRAANPNNGRGSKKIAEGEFVCLPTNFREPSRRSKAAINPGPKLPTQPKPRPKPRPKPKTKPKGAASKRKSKGKGKAKPRTTTKSKIGGSSILHARNDVNEAKLLEAQRGTPKKGKAGKGGGMLTQEALEEDEDMQDYIDDDDDDGNNDDKVSVYWEDEE